MFFMHSYIHTVFNMIYSFGHRGTNIKLNKKKHNIVNPFGYSFAMSKAIVGNSVSLYLIEKTRDTICNILIIDK